MEKYSLRTFLILVTVLGCLLGLAVSGIKQVREEAKKLACQNNLKQFALGILNHESAFMGLPSAVTIGPDGKPWHSWRSIVWPHMESIRVAYDPRNGPWNGPSNKRFLDYRFNWAECPSDSHVCRHHDQVSYLVITGPGTAFPADKQIDMSDFKDGPENTILVVESLNSGRQLTEPGDLELQTMSFKINDPTKPCISSHHPGGANVVFADAKVYFVTEQISPEELKALISIAGGESITRDDLVRRGVLK